MYLWITYLCFISDLSSVVVVVSFETNCSGSSVLPSWSPPWGMHDFSLPQVTAWLWNTTDLFPESNCFLILLYSLWLYGIMWNNYPSKPWRCVYTKIRMCRFTVCVCPGTLVGELDMKWVQLMSFPNVCSSYYLNQRWG